MEWVDRLNAAIRYIEEHLTDEIDYEQLGQIACCSSYHFQRMFGYLAGVTLSEYIRKRRMSLAAVDLQNGNEKIIDIAQKYGYSSPTAFNRAFQSVHGIAPSAVQSGITLTSFPAMTFTISIKGEIEMNYRIETKAAFRIVGISVPIAKEMEKNFAAIPEKWDAAAHDGTIERLVFLNDVEPEGILGLCVTDDENWRYYIATASTQKKEELEEYFVPAAQWAIFEGSGSVQSLQELEQRVLTEWLPSSGYEYGNAPDIEVYYELNPEHARYAFWIPVVKK